MYECYITIGDWSEDGHNRYRVFQYFATHPVIEQQQGYYASVERTGIRFHGHSIGDPHEVCVEYQDGLINAFHIEMLRRYAQIDCSRAGDCGPSGFYPEPDEFAKFVLWFVGITIPGFEYERLKEVNTKSRDSEGHMSNTQWLTDHGDQVLNGWWCDKLNHQFGYGVFENRSYLRDSPPRWTFKEESGVKVLHKDNMALYGHYAARYPYDVALPPHHAMDQAWAWFKPVTREREPHPFYDPIKDWLEARNVNCLLIYGRIFFEDQTEATLFRMFHGQ